jgi:AraC-like DNA-binding protein
MREILPNLVFPKIVHARTQHGGRINSYVDREYVFQYCERGEVDFRLETRVYRMTAGVALLMPPHLPHALTMIRDAHQKYVIIHFKLPDESTLLHPFPLAIRFPRKDARAAEKLMHQLVHEWSTRAAGFDLIISGLMVQILGLFWRNSEAGVAPRPVASKAWRSVERVIPWMHQNFRDSISIEEMSRRAALSPAYFCKAFKEYTGRSPHNYLTGVRIEKARQLLCDAELNCSEVADRVGYPTVAAFSKAFKQTIGVSPSNWVEENLLHLGKRVRYSERAEDLSIRLKAEN